MTSLFRRLAVALLLTGLAFGCGGTSKPPPPAGQDSPSGGTPEKDKGKGDGPLGPPKTPPIPPPP